MRRWSFLLIMLLLITSCKKKGCTDPTAINYSAEAQKDDGSCTFENEPEFSTKLSIVPLVNGLDVIYDALIYSHPLGYNFSVTNLKFFISDVVLHKTCCDSIVLNGAFYFNCMDGPEMVELSDLEIPDGDYTGVSFYFGLNETYNVTNYFINPPESLMEWPIPMGGGYHYMKFEGKYDSLGTIKNFNLHTGALNGTPYHFRVLLNEPFTAADGDVTIKLNMNLENWLQQPNDFDFNVYGSAIMGNASAQTVLMQNGYNVFTLDEIE